MGFKYSPNFFIIFLVIFFNCRPTTAEDYKYPASRDGDEDYESVYGNESENNNTLGEKIHIIEKKIDQLIQATRKQHLGIETMENFTTSDIISQPSDSCRRHSKPYKILNVKCAEDQVPTSCSKIKECNDHIYNIMHPKYSEQPFPVACDFETESGGWTIIQRRQDGSVNFNRNWTEYVQGFGDLNGEFFIGLEKLHVLTSLGGPQELYIILEDFEGERRYAHYHTFQVGSNDTYYTLTVDGYKGNAGDSLEYHNETKFSTWDQNNEEFDGNCASSFKGAWWFGDCHTSHLNGEYLLGSLPQSRKGKGIVWHGFRGPQYSLKYVQMMIRPKQ